MFSVMSAENRAKNIFDYLPIYIVTECRRLNDGMHFHQHTHLWYALSGTCEQTFDNGDTFFQKPGSCVVVEPFAEHNFNTSVSTDTPLFVSITFPDEFLSKRGFKFFSIHGSPVLFENRYIPRFCELSGATKEIADMLILKILAEYSKKKNMNVDYIADLLSEFLLIIGRNGRVPKNIDGLKERTDSIHAVIKYISENIDKKISIDSLLPIAAMSRRVFTRGFKETTGKSVAQYIIGERLRRAKLLLVFTNKSMSEIAKEVGVYDKARLSRLFTEHFGMSPKEYRKLNAERAIEGDKVVKKRLAWVGERFWMSKD